MNSSPCEQNGEPMLSLSITLFMRLSMEAFIMPLVMRSDRFGSAASLA